MNPEQITLVKFDQPFFLIFERRSCHGAREERKGGEGGEREGGFEVIDIRPSFRSCMKKHASLFSPVFRNGKL
jgi:hypothetical protein